MNSNDPGLARGLEITLPHGRNSNGFKTFWLNVDDEVSFVESKDHRGDPCAVEVRKDCGVLFLIGGRCWWISMEQRIERVVNKRASRDSLASSDDDLDHHHLRRAFAPLLHPERLGRSGAPRVSSVASR